MVDEPHAPDPDNNPAPESLSPAADLPEPATAELREEGEAHAGADSSGGNGPPAALSAATAQPEEELEPEPQEAAADGVPAEPPAAPAEEDRKHWYVVKVQSGREESIKDAIERRVKIEGLEEFFGEIIIPKEKETVINRGRRVIREKKLYPGYLMANVEFNDRILYLFRETSGVGDFVGGSLNHPPQPMSAREVEKMKLSQQPGVAPTEVVIKPKFSPGDRVRVKDGVFSGMEGEVRELIEAKNLVRVELTVLGRPVPVELEYWQVETP